MIDLAASSSDPTPFQWGPIILLVMTSAIALGAWVFRTIFKTINDHTSALATQSTALAVLVTETRNPIKTVNEVIDLKLASSELNEKVISLNKSVDQLWSMQDNTQGRRHNE